MGAGSLEDVGDSVPRLPLQRVGVGRSGPDCVGTGRIAFEQEVDECSDPGGQVSMVRVRDVQRRCGRSPLLEDNLQRFQIGMYIRNYRVLHRSSRAFTQLWQTREIHLLLRSSLLAHG